MPVVNDLVHLLRTGRQTLGQADDLNLGVSILLNRQVFLVVEQVNDFTAVNLEETHVEFHVCGGQLKHVPDSLLRRCRNRESLTRTCLSVGKQRHDSSLEQGRDEVFDLVLVQRSSVLILRVSVVEIKVTVLNVLCYSIDLELWVVDVDLGVGDGDHIDLSLHCLLFEEGPLAHANANVHLRATHMIEGRTHLATLLANKNVKVDVDVASERLVERVLVELGLLLLFVLAPTVRPGGLHLFDVVDDVAGAGLAVLLHGCLFISLC